MCFAASYKGLKGVNRFDRRGLWPYDCAPMSKDSLPRQVDVRKLAASGASLHAVEPIAVFSRLAAQLLDLAGDVEIDLDFALDEQRRRIVRGRVQAQLRVPCQRCLQAMTLPVDSEFAVGVVWDDEDARQLPRELEPYVLGEAPHELYELVEDELLLSLPYTSYHPEAECSHRAGYSSGEDEVAPEPKDNPFKVLEQFKPGK